MHALSLVDESSKLGRCKKKERGGGEVKNKILAVCDEAEQGW
jgi:hypothetical protein